MLPRTFSLARLLLAVTLIAVLCGLAVNFPHEAFDVVLVSFVEIPTLVVALVLAFASRNRMTVLIVALLGGLVGALFSPAVAYSGPPLDWWQHYKLVYVSTAPYMVLGALVVGVPLFLHDSFPAV